MKNLFNQQLMKKYHLKKFKCATYDNPLMFEDSQDSS